MKTFWQKFQENLSKPLKPVQDPPGVLRIRLCVIWLPVVAVYIPAVYAREGDREGVGTVYVDLSQLSSFISRDTAFRLGLKIMTHPDWWVVVDELILDGKNGVALKVTDEAFVVLDECKIGSFVSASGMLGRGIFKRAGYEPKVDWMRRELVLTPLNKEQV